MITPIDNLSLMTPFTLAKVRLVVFSLPPDKASGPNGFTTLFFQKTCDIIFHDLLVVLEEFGKNKTMLKCFNATNIVIIPKNDDP